MNQSLPEQMRQLIVSIHQEVLFRAHQEIQAVDTTYQQNIDRAKSLFNQQQIDTQKEFGKVAEEIKRLRQKGQALLSNGQSHLKKYDIGLPPTLETGFSSRPTHLDKAKDLLSEADKMWDELRNVEVRFWFNNGCLTLFIVGLSFIIAVYAAREAGLLGFILAFVFSLFCIPVIQYLVRTSRVKNLYSSMAHCISESERILDTNFTKAQQEMDAKIKSATESLEMANTTAQKDRQAELQSFQSWLNSVAEKTQQQCEGFSMKTLLAGASWKSNLWQEWGPATSPAFVAGFGQMLPDTKDWKQGFPSINLNFAVPTLIPFSDGKCFLLEANDAAKQQAIQCLQSIMVRLLATIPPGKLNFVFIDPVGLGQNVAGFMKLAEYDESLIKSRAWTEPAHIEQRLAELTEHMENVIQKYLRTDFKNIEEYNEKAQEVAEPYRLLVVMDFPTNFSDAAARRLVSIASNGPRCGVYTLVMMDTNKKLPHGFNLADLEQHSFVIRYDGDQFKWEDTDFRSCRLQLDVPPDNQFVSKAVTEKDQFGHPQETSKQISLTNHIVESVGERAKEAMKVEVPFAKLLAQANLDKLEWWFGSTERNLQVPLGPTGARKLQMFTFGEGLTHHGLIVGRPGSGKTNLMHVIITTLALKYPPEELQLYLIDFKKGVGFKPYAEYKLPHAVAIAIESEREFGLSVLQGMDKEMQQRGEQFRREGVEDIAEYRRKTRKTLPRILLVADEFQEFFSHNDSISTQSSLLLDRLTRQGRAFGIHLLLGTQTLQGSNSLPKSILNQVALRIALQCSADDSRIILSDDNPAARLLSRPGEAIYNASNGLVEGNNFFQVALFTDDDRREYLHKVQMLAGGNGDQREPLVFEGNEPASIEKCRPLNELLAKENSSLPPKVVNVWLGEPTAIRDPISARIRRQSGNNLLIVSRDEEEGIGMLTAVQLSLMAQHAPEQTKIYVANFISAETPMVEIPEQIAEIVPHLTTVIGRRQLPTVLKELMAEVNERISGTSANAPSLYLLIAGLHRARDLRQEESGFNDDGIDANELFISLLREGPEVGVHVIVWCDSYANLARVLSRRQMGEFGLRVAAAMSNDDSQNLLDDGAAARLDKPHRAIFYDEERPGLLEKFRPYKLPDAVWLSQIRSRLNSELVFEHTDLTTNIPQQDVLVLDLL